MARYIQASFEEAAEQNLPHPWDEEWDLDDFDDPDWKQGIWKIEDDGSISFVACDGGEPEDNSFRRDGSWILGALNDAFEHGFKFGYAKGVKGE